MSHDLPLFDFRARRTVLDPDDFALGGDEPEPPPSDLVSKGVWHSIVDLADDVSIRTSNHHGRVLAVQNGLWAAWIEALPFEAFEQEASKPAVRGILDATDEFHACTFEMLTGYYRQAASSLRSAFEVVLAGAYETVTGNTFDEFKYRVFREDLGKSERAHELDPHLRTRCDRCVFAAARHDPWIGDLYGRLTDYAHVHRGHSLGDIRQSNGPIHVPQAVIDIHILFVETFMLLAVLVRLVRPDFSISSEGRDWLLASGVVPTEVAAHALAVQFPDVFPNAAALLTRADEGPIS